MSKQINPILGKNNKRSGRIKYIIGLIIFFMVSYIAQDIFSGRDDKMVYDAVKDKISDVKIGFEKLSKEDKQRWLALREKVIKIYQDYLSESEFNDFWGIIQKASSQELSVDEFRRGEYYDSKVRKMCTSKQRKILDEMGRLNMKIAEGK